MSLSVGDFYVSNLKASGFYVKDEPAILCLTTPATLQAGAKAPVQCSQGGFLFSAAVLP